MNRPRFGDIRKSLLVVVFIAGTGLLVFANSLRNPFLFDDFLSLNQNPSIRSLQNPWNALWAPYENPLAGRPIVNLSFAINFSIGGLNPWGYHFVNLVLHCVNGWLLFLIIRYTLAMSANGSRSAVSKSILALATTILWLVHPLQTEVINYVTQRTELLQATFFLLTLYCAIRSYQSAFHWTCLSIVSCAFGMLCKESMVTTPVVVVLYDYTFIGGSLRELLRRRKTLYLGLALTWLVLAGILISGPRSGSVGFGLGVSSWEYALTQCWAVSRYLLLIFWPDRLLIDYGDVPQTSPAAVVPGIITLSAVLTIMVWLWIRNRHAVFCLLTFFVLLAPTSTIVPIVTEMGAERRVYLAMALIVVLVVYGLDKLIRSTNSRYQKHLFAAVVFVWATALGGRTLLRNAEFGDQVRLWRNAVEYLPTNGRAYTSLAEVLIRVEDFPAALEAARRAVQLDPEAIDGHFNLGVALSRSKRFDEALLVARRILARSPNYQKAIVLAAISLRETGQLKQSAAYLDEALRRDPSDASAWFEQGNLLRDQNKPDEASECYFRSASIKSEIVAESTVVEQAHRFSGLAFEQNLQFVTAIRHYRKAVEMKPMAKTLCHLGRCLAQTGQLDEATAALNSAIEFDPDLAEAHFELAGVWESIGNTKRALEAYRQVITITPNDMAALRLMAALHAKRGEFDLAIQQLKSALQKSFDLDATLDLAWLLSTCPVENLRDADEGLRLAHHGRQQVSTPYPRADFVVAVALANVERLDEAIMQAREAHKLALKEGDTFMAQSIAAWLSRHENKVDDASPIVP